MKPRTPALVLLAMLLPSSLTAQERSSEETIRERYEEAVTAYRAGDYDVAARAYIDVYRLNPDPILLYNAAYAFGRAGDFERAVEEAERARRLGLDGAEVVARNEARILAWSTRSVAIGVVADRAASPNALRTDIDVDDRPRSRWNVILGSSLGVLGVGALAGAVGTSLRIRAGKQTLREESSRPEYDTTLTSLERTQSIGRALLVGGVSLTVVGGSLFFFGSGGADR